MAGRGGPRMKIHFYGICWNEAAWLPYFFRHYDRWVERYVVFDNGSDDSSLKILNEQPRVDLRTFAAVNESIVETAQQLKSTAWKESRGQADLVLICDVDELVWHPHLVEFLESSRAEGKTIFQPSGWQMVHDRFPTTPGQAYDEVRQGFRCTDYDKPCLFDPNRIQEINYSPGCHFAEPTGEVAWCRDESLRLLHFKYLGVPYVTNRYAALHARLGSRDRTERWGAQYAQSAAEIHAQFDRFSLTELSFHEFDAAN